MVNCSNLTSGAGLPLKGDPAQRSSYVVLGCPAAAGHNTSFTGSFKPQAPPRRDNAYAMSHQLHNER